MAKIEQVQGNLLSVDTDAQKLQLRVTGEPYRPGDSGMWYEYELDLTEDEFVAKVGTVVACTLFDGVVKRLRPA
ncbi:MAG: hypothetical protein AAB270_04480 [Chloroflexota bacterium]